MKEYGELRKRFYTEKEQSESDIEELESEDSYERKEPYEASVIVNASAEEGAIYMQYARVLLGEMKQRMEMLDMQQLTATKTLENGVVIAVHSIFGQDEIAIVVPKKQAEKEAKKETKKDKEEYQPYMWVGARLMNTDSLLINMIVIEPEQKGITSTLNSYWWYFWDLFDAMTVNKDGDGIKERVDQEIARINEPDVAGNLEAYSIIRPIERVSFGLRCIVGAWDTVVNFTRDGLKQYDWLSGSSVAGGHHWNILPYDPISTKEERESYKNSWYDGTNDYSAMFDTVAVLDPDTSTAPTSPIEDEIMLHNALEKVGYAVKVLNGNYVIKLQGNGQWCNGIQPTANVHIRVAVGKEPNTEVKDFYISLIRGSNYFKHTSPFGNRHVGNSCASDTGNNNHNESWWQGAILVDVANGVIEFKDYYLSDNFIPDGSEVNCTLIPDYVIGCCAVVTMQTGADIGHWVYTLRASVEGVTIDGVINGSNNGVAYSQVTEAEIIAVFPAITGDDAFIYDPMTNTVENIGIQQFWRDIYRRKYALEYKYFGVVHIGLNLPSTTFTCTGRGMGVFVDVPCYPCDPPAVCDIWNAQPC